jgi:outer membrane protein OmpA-like peptidoglycan-associated protein
MNGPLKGILVGLLVAPLAAGCATKGALRRAIEGERVARTQADSMLAAQSQRDVQAVRTDLDGVRSDVSTLRNDLAALRSELQSLRTDFNAKITAVEEGMQFMLPVNFAFDDASVRSEDVPTLDRFASVVRKYYPTAKITVEGFADPAGSASYNRVLSERRAEAVRGHLTQTGLDASLIRAIGYGETRPVIPGAQRDAVGAEQNRRVVFVIESKDAAAVIATIDDVIR